MHAMKTLLGLMLLMVSSLAIANVTYSGSWFNPERDGEGFHIEILDNERAMIIWFTYPGDTDNDTSEQSWILGNGEIDDKVLTFSDAFKSQGPVFGKQFNTDDLSFTTWGDIRVTFSDDDNAVVDYNGLDGVGRTEVTRLTRLADRADAWRLPVGMSGAWFNPKTNGQGWFVEVLSDSTALVYWFTYDGNGNPAWNVGVGYIDGNRIVIPNSLSGKGTQFGEGFDATAVKHEPFATIVIEYADCQSGTANYSLSNGMESDTLSVVRLTTLNRHNCKVMVANANEGGSIQSDSGTNDCREDEICLLDVVEETAFNDVFTAVPRVGQVFLGWQQGEQHLCGGSTEPCELVSRQTDLADVNGDTRLTALFEPDGSIFSPARDSLWVCSYTKSVDLLEYECEIKDFEQYGYGKLEDYKVNNGTLFVDTEARKEELDRLPLQIKHEWCRTDKMSHIDMATFTAVPPIDSGHVPPESDIFELLIWGRIHYLYFDDEQAGRMVLRQLLAWAEAEVDLNVDFVDNFNSLYQLGLIAPIYMDAWDSIRDAAFVYVENREKVDEYLHQLMIRLSVYVSQREGFDEFVWGDALNQGWSQDLPLMVYGVMKGNDLLFQRVVARFFNILDGLVRPDGSHHYGSQRGGQALSYSTYQTAFMVRMAELAAHQGYNLYDVEVDGISLHTIMDFHVRAIETPELLHQYTRYQNPDFANADQRAHWNQQLCTEDHQTICYEGPWPTFEIYRRRFPDSPLQIAHWLTVTWQCFPSRSTRMMLKGHLCRSANFARLHSRCQIKV
jgi:hypothetical protein